MPSVLEQAVAFIREGEREKAKSLLIEILKQDPRNETAWLSLAECVTEAEQKRYCLEKVLQINPQNQDAVRDVEYLNPPVLPPAQPEIAQRQPVQKPQPGAKIFAFFIFGIGAFLVLLFLYAWWLAR